MRATLVRNTFPGRSPWMMTVTTKEGQCLTSWHRTIALAEHEAAALHGIKKVERL